MNNRDQRFHQNMRFRNQSHRLGNLLGNLTEEIPDEGATSSGRQDVSQKFTDIRRENFLCKMRNSHNNEINLNQLNISSFVGL